MSEKVSILIKEATDALIENYRAELESIRVDHEVELNKLRSLEKEFQKVEQRIARLVDAIKSLKTVTYGHSSEWDERVKKL